MLDEQSGRFPLTSQPKRSWLRTTSLLLWTPSFITRFYQWFQTASFFFLGKYNNQRLWANSYQLFLSFVFTDLKSSCRCFLSWESFFFHQTSCRHNNKVSLTSMLGYKKLTTIPQLHILYILNTLYTYTFTIYTLYTLFYYKIFFFHQTSCRHNNKVSLTSMLGFQVNNNSTTLYT